MHEIMNKKFYLSPKFGTLFNKSWITNSELLQLRHYTSTTAPALVSSARIVPTAGKSAASRSTAHDDQDLLRRKQIRRPR
jgi:hypothetical protein